jgi:hypothetical protein
MDSMDVDDVDDFEEEENHVSKPVVLYPPVSAVVASVSVIYFKEVFTQHSNFIIITFYF